MAENTPNADDLGPVKKTLGIAYLVGAVAVFVWSSINLQPLAAIAAFVAYVFVVPIVVRQHAEILGVGQ